MKRTSIVVGALIVLALARTPMSAQQAASAIPNLTGKALTVKGPVDPSTLGQTLMHEHIFIEFKRPPSAIPQAGGSGALQAGPQPPGWNLLNDFDESLAEVMEFKKAGGQTIVDVTNIGLSRDPRALLRISDASGLTIVMGAGWYQKGLHAADMTDRTVEELTEVVVRDVTVGAQGTNIRSGIIGEVGVQGNPLTDNEIKSVRASARAARITGAPMTLHSFGSPDEMLRVLDVIASEGVALSRVVMGHMGSRDMAYLKRVLERGVYIEYDYLGQAPGPNGSAERDERLVQNITDVIKAGFVRQLMVAHDICTKPQLKKNGGGGYAYIANVVLPGLKRKGVSDEDIRTIMVENPRRVLTFVAPQP
jgi:phosphotriesterase-related protein